MARTPPIYELIDELPTRSITVRVLNALDHIVPGDWENLVGFTETIQAVTGERDDAVVQRIGERAIALYNDRRQGYKRALGLYRAVDRADRLAIGPLALINTAGEQIRWLSFMKRVTPKAETLQALDLGLKLVAEISAFCLINGIPGDSIGDFVESLGAYGKESRMRMAALVALDGVLPLGPNFLDAAADVLRGTKPDELAENKLYQSIDSYLPGGSQSSKYSPSQSGQGASRSSKYSPSQSGRGPSRSGKYSPQSGQGGGQRLSASAGAASKYSPDPGGHLNFIQDSLGEVRGWMADLVDRTDMTREKVADGLSRVVQVSDTTMDYLAAFLDMSTYYFEHTGTQTLARRLIERAVNEI